MKNTKGKTYVKVIQNFQTKETIWLNAKEIIIKDGMTLEDLLNKVNELQATCDRQLEYIVNTAKALSLLDASVKAQIAEINNKIGGKK